MSSSALQASGVVAFAVSCCLFVGLRSIHFQLRGLKTEIARRNRRDFIGRDYVSTTGNVDLLLELHSVMSQEPNVEAVLQRVVEVAYKFLRAQRISVMVLNHDKTRFIVLASKDAAGEEIDATQGIGSAVVASGELLHIRNAYKDSRFNPHFDQVTGFRTESMLCCPMKVNGETIGVVYVINKLNDEEEIVDFEKADEDLLRHFAATASIAIKKTQMHHDAVRAQKNSEALLSIVRSRTSNEELEKILATTILAVRQLILPDRVSVYICDATSQEIWMIRSCTEGLEGITMKFGQGIAGFVAATGQSIRIPDAYQDSRFNDAVDRETGYRTKGVLCVGVPGFSSNSKPIAVVQLLNKMNDKPFNQDDQDSLELLCKELSFSLRQKVEQMSYLRQTTLNRDRSVKRVESICMEESFLYEFGAVSQCYKFSAMIPSRHITETESVGFSSEECNFFDEWDYDPLFASDSDLMQNALIMFADFSLVETFNIDHRKLKNLIMGAHALYHDDTPFHNFKHAWSVMHMSYMILRHGAAQYLTPLDVLATLVAALCHDLDHPGTNNGYEVASQSDLALTHSYDAVLERHHASMTHRLLSSHSSNILEGLPEEEEKYVRGVITDAIMATNMAEHFKHVERLEVLSKNDPPFDINSPSSRRELVGYIVHTADLSAQTLPLELACAWGERCISEFRRQAELEKQNGYPVTAFMASLDTDEQVMRTQAGFVGSIVLPLWSAMAVCFPALHIRCCQAQSNHDYYSSRALLQS